jgi:hypothetical protein
MKHHHSWQIRVQVIVALVFFLSAAAPLGVGAAHTQAAFSCSQTSGMNQADCEALVAIYQAAGGQNWVNPAGWLQTNTPCSWAGVNCSGDRVKNLDLRSQGLVGALPPQLGNLTELELLWLTRNRITALPSQIGSLDLLMELGLEYNQLAVLPPEIGDLDSLRFLWLQGNQLSALPVEIGGLTNLQTLIISGNKLTALPDEIGGLESLGTLDVSNNRLSSLPGSIGSLSKLMTLNVEHNALSVLPAEIGNFPTLWNLMLEGNQLSALPAEAAQLTKLKRLGLGANAFSILPAQIGGMTALEDLHLHDNPLTGELPSDLTAYPLNEITFYGTGWCLPASGPTREWVLNRNSVVTSGRVCGVENTGTISGRATLPGGASAAGVHVHLYSILEGGKHRYVKSVKTAADGTYSFTGLGHGPGAGYKVQFMDQT